MTPSPTIAEGQQNLIVLDDEGPSRIYKVRRLIRSIR